MCYWLACLTPIIALAVSPGILVRRHEALREVVCAMLSSVGLDCDQVDCTKNVLLTARLQAGK